MPLFRLLIIIIPLAGNPLFLLLPILVFLACKAFLACWQPFFRPPTKSFLLLGKAVLACCHTHFLLLVILILLVCKAFLACRQPFFRLSAGLFLLFGRTVVKNRDQLTLLPPEFNTTFLTTVLPVGKSAPYGDFRTFWLSGSCV